MLNSVGNLCGYIYFTSNNSFLYFCALCEGSFKSSENFQNHNLKEHYLKSANQTNFETIQESKFNTENAMSTVFPLDSDHNLEKVTSEDPIKLENEIHIKIEEIDCETTENSLNKDDVSEGDLIPNSHSNIGDESDQSDANIQNTPAFLPFGLDDLDETNFQCKYCKKQFITRLNLVHHTQNHLNYSLTCKICGKHSSRKSYARSHEKTHVKLKCDLCEATFSHDKLLERHKMHHENLRCKMCSKIFKTCEQNRIHMRTHTGEKPYKCDACSSAFAIKKNLQNHVITQHTGDIKNFDCKSCDKRFKTKQLLHFHIKRVHLKEKPNQCEFCGLNFSNMSGLRRHKLKRHTEYSKRPHPCKLCDRKFVELTNLTEHMNTHTGEKPFQCNICLKNFGQQGSLKEHKKLHTGKKTHICKICGKAFVQQSGYSNHMKQHRIIGYVK